jgi:Leucine-rich repeat (LRR) protein
MLNTFENAEKQHLRRLDRERHLQVINSLASGSALADTDDLHPTVDALIGAPLATAQVPLSDESKSKQSSAFGSRRRTKRPAIVFACLVLVVVLTATLLLRDGLDEGNSPTRGNPDQGSNPGNTNGQDRSKYNNLFSMILDWQVTPRSVLEETTSAANRALQWLAFDDRLASVDRGTIRARYALATLYYSTNASWKTKSHWMSSYPVCLWHGIQCIDSQDTIGLVKSVNLTWNGLVGTIPPEIALLKSELVFFDISGNAIQGSIPDLAPLENLQQLYLGSNNLSGTIPSTLYNLSLLTHLYLEECKLSGPLSSTIGQLSNLEGLDLHSNFFSSSIPSSIGKLTDLSVLYMDTNTLTGIIPTTIGALTRLVDLRLRRNQLRGPIPAQITRLHTLQVLYLNSNELTGTIPVALAKLPLMRELHLYDNNIEGTIPDELNSLTLLTVLYLDQNQLKGRIPTTLSNLNYLESIYLFDNDLTGPIPTELGALPSLKRLLLHHNKLTGRIPAQLGALPKLETLYLHNNTLTGLVPAALLGNLSTTLTAFQFQGNQITGLVNCENVDTVKLVVC